MIGEHEAALEAALLRYLYGAGIDEITSLVGTDLAGYYPDQAVPNLRTRWVLDKALSAPGPELLVRVIRRSDLAAGGALPPGLIQIAERLESGSLAWRGGRADDPITIDPDLPFLDREYFRHLFSTGGGNGAGGEQDALCTLIQGERGAGKSYLVLYARHLGSVRSDLRVATATVPETTSSTLLPEATALELASWLGTDPLFKPPRHEDPCADANVESLVSWLVSSTPRRTRPALVLLDGLDRDDLPDWLHAFVRKLLQHLYDPNSGARERFRVVLLGYEPSRLTGIGIPNYRPLVLGHIDQGHVEEWFRKQYPGMDERKYEYVSRLIASQIPESGPQRLSILNANIRMYASRFGA